LRPTTTPCRRWYLPKIVREYRQRYKGISRLLDENPEILDRVHEDLKRLSDGGRRGRKGDFTSETILRALIVHAEDRVSGTAASLP